MCISVCVCVHVYKCVCVCVHVYKCVCVRACVYKCVCDGVTGVSGDLGEEVGLIEDDPHCRE